jgi:site-specific recombinase
MHQSSHNEQSMQACIEACSHCHQVCLLTAMNHCLNNGGKYVEAEHFRLFTRVFARSAPRSVKRVQ